MLMRVFGEQGSDGSMYRDVEPDAWYKNQAGLALELDLFPNRGSYLKPGAPLTRGDAFIALYQYLRQ